MSDEDTPPPPARRRAVAVRYRGAAANAPELTAKGAGTLAERLIQGAIDAGVPVREDQFLVEVLSRLDLGVEVPPETYEAMAALLAEIYRIDRDAGAG